MKKKKCCEKKRIALCTYQYSIIEVCGQRKTRFAKIYTVVEIDCCVNLRA